MNDSTPQPTQTKEIPLTQGQVAIVDAADYDFLMQWKWYAHCSHGRWYAQRDVRIDGKRHLILMHRVVLGDADSPCVDHVDGNGLENTRDNLRPATKVQNGRNRPVQRNSKSGYKGVFWHRECAKWTAKIRTDTGNKYLGLFATAEEAARAYDVAAKELHGGYAWLNFP